MLEILKNSPQKIVIYGGNGYVGTHLAQKLQTYNLDIVCLSRSGHKPLHLNNEAWSENVRWCKGDAHNADQNLLKTADVVVICVGSAPIPTFSSAAHQKQLSSNGKAPSNAIQSAQDAGVKKIVLMGAHIPFFLNNSYFAYAQGKKNAFNAAKAFANTSNEHTATVLQPGAILGKRYLANGKVIPIDTLLSPFAKLAPSHFISIDKVTEYLVNAILDNELHTERFSVIGPSKMCLHQSKVLRTNTSRS